MMNLSEMFVIYTSFMKYERTIIMLGKNTWQGTQYYYSIA